MKKKIAFIILSAILALCNLNARQPAGGQDVVKDENAVLPNNIFQLLTAPDTINNTVIRIFQDKRIEQLFSDRQLLNTKGVISGFRVQVFSSNVQQLSRIEAQKIESLIREAFPDKPVYLKFDSPFWKVRVGDFRTREDAQPLLNDLKKAFPDLKGGMYIVPDDINIFGTK